MSYPQQQLGAPRFWDVDLLSSCCEDPATCLLGSCCPPCMAYAQRKRTLAFVGEPHSCCQKDSFPRTDSCCWSAYTPPIRPLPAVWPLPEGSEEPFNCEMALEACCCLGCSIGATRELMKFKFGVNDSDCDVATICGTLILCCCFRRHARDAGYHFLMGCLITQQSIQLQNEESKRLALGGAGPQQQTMGGTYAPPQMNTSPYMPQQQQQGYVQPQQGYQQVGYQQQQTYQGVSAQQQPYQPQQQQQYGAPQYGAPQGYGAAPPAYASPNPQQMH